MLTFPKPVIRAGPSALGGGLVGLVAVAGNEGRAHKIVADLLQKPEDWRFASRLEGRPVLMGRNNSSENVASILSVRSIIPLAYPACSRTRLRDRLASTPLPCGEVRPSSSTAAVAPDRGSGAPGV